jgi:hypothetical protein
MTTKITNPMTTQEVAQRFNDLAQQEKWFEIHDELFADNVRSIEPSGSLYFDNAEGKASVRKKGEEIVTRVTAFHGASTSQPVVARDHFTVRRQFDVTMEGIGRLQMDEIILYEVRDGKIVVEQFFY